MQNITTRNAIKIGKALGTFLEVENHDTSGLVLPPLGQFATFMTSPLLPSQRGLSFPMQHQVLAQSPAPGGIIVQPKSSLFLLPHDVATTVATIAVSPTISQRFYSPLARSM